jgi:hypothetical protein
MSAPKKARKPRRKYGQALDGSKIVSVTEVIGALGKPGLMWWAAEEAARACAAYLREGAAEHDAIERARKAFLRTRDAAAEAGTLAHEMIEAYLEGQDPEDVIDAFADVDVVDRARRAFSRFASWWPTSGYTVHLSEEQIVDRATGYGGTLDLVLRAADGSLVIGDVKTGRGVYDEVTIQLAAYAALLRSERQTPVTRGLVIHCPADGALDLIDITGEQLEHGARIFAALLVVTRGRPLIQIVRETAAHAA